MWSFITAIIVISALVFEVLNRVVVPWAREPRFDVVYPDGSKTSSVRRGTQQHITTFYIRHIGGRWKVKGRAAKDLWVYCYVPPDFALLEGLHEDNLFTRISRNPPTGELADYKYVAVGQFCLTPGDTEEVSIKFNCPNIACTALIYCQISEEGLKYLVRSRLTLTLF